MNEKILKFSSLFFLFGFFTCTWDLLFKVDLYGFTLKIHQGFFGISFLLAFWGNGKQRFSILLASIKHKFAICALLLFAYYLLSSPFSFFPKKSFFYSLWFFYNFLTIWLTAQWIAPMVQKQWLRISVWVTLVFHSLVVLIDHLAYQFGHTSGFVGFNQDQILLWGVSRPHAFASEPSYIATFFCLSILFLYGFLIRANPWQYIPLNILSFMALFATGSRTGLLGLALGSGFLIGIESWRRKKVPILPALVILILFGLSSAIIYFSVPKKQIENINKNLVGSVVTGTDGSGNARLRALGIANELLKDSNYLGVGMGASYRYWVEKTRPPLEETVGSDHGKEVIMSIWGQLLAEGGIPGILIYFGMAVFMILSLWKIWLVNPDSLVTGALVSSVVYFFFIALWIGNVARGDIWVWFAVWSLITKLKDESAVA
jgi:hypothetical protein